MSEKQTQKIFFSWQSDSPELSNKRAIRAAINKAISELEEVHDGFEFKQDEATRDVSGAVNIPITILDKIKECDIFIADCTTINPNQELGRRFPNPNVLFELGFAVSRLGWGRIILLFNSAYGKFPDDLPFDIDRHRVTVYKLKAENAPKKGNPDSTLSAALRDAIGQIVCSNPPRPTDRQTAAEIKHTRDMAMVQWAISAIQPAVLDNMYRSLPWNLDYSAIYFCEALDHILRSSSFRLYDAEAERLFWKILIAWRKCVKPSNFYFVLGTKHQYKLIRSGTSQHQSAKVAKLNKAVGKLSRAVSALMAHCDKNYIEIDIKEAQQRAFDSFREECSNE